VSGKTGTTGELKPTAGKVGTQITVPLSEGCCSEAEDLFYNSATRLKVLRNLNEE
jgi:DNA mismatch repair ATPase MutL